MAVGAGAGARTPPYTDLSARDDGKFLAQQFSVVLPRSCSSLNTDVFTDDIFQSSFSNILLRVLRFCSIIGGAPRNSLLSGWS